MNKTKIEWADARYNPVTGCWGPGGTPEKPNRCSYCYAERMSKRLRGRFGYPSDDPFKPTFHPGRLNEPLHNRKPTRYFCGTMGDLFTPCAKGEELQRADWLERVLAVMACCPQHTFMVLTKQPERAAEWLSVGCRSMMVAGAAHDMGLKWLLPQVPMSEFWPLKNLWLGTSCENQAAANERIPHLLAAPAALRFVSLEPLLGSVDLCQYVERTMVCKKHGRVPASRWMTTKECGMCLDEGLWPPNPLVRDLRPGLDWVIVGAQSGPGAKPPDFHWVSSLLQQCVDARVPIFLKDNLGLGNRVQEWPEVRA